MRPSRGPLARALPCLVSLLVAALLPLLVQGSARGSVRSAEPATDATRAEPAGVWPLEPEPRVVEDFAPPEDPWGAGHRGVDLAGAPGQVVRSALAGTVSFAGSIAGKPVVTVRHGDLRTTYEPVVASVGRGDVVAAGDVVGRLVVPASHCFPDACLHWGLIRGDTYLDPLSLVGGGPIRLLPLWRDAPVSPRADAAAEPAIPWLSALAAWRRPLDALP